MVFMKYLVMNNPNLIAQYNNKMYKYNASSESLNTYYILKNYLIMYLIINPYYNFNHICIKT